MLSSTPSCYSSIKHICYSLSPMLRSFSILSINLSFPNLVLGQKLSNTGNVAGVCIKISRGCFVMFFQTMPSPWFGKQFPMPSPIWNYSLGAVRQQWPVLGQSVCHKVARYLQGCKRHHCVKEKANWSTIRGRCLPISMSINGRVDGSFFVVCLYLFVFNLSLISWYSSVDK